MDPSKEPELAPKLRSLEVRNERDEACFPSHQHTARRGGGEARTDNVEAEGDEAMVLGEGEGRREERSLESEDMFEVIDQAFAV